MDTQHNPYQAPDALIAEPVDDADNLAKLSERFAAVVLDSLLLLSVIVPAMYFGGYREAVMTAVAEGGSLPFASVVLWAVFGFLVFVVIQGYPLHTTGQTWGKRVLGIKIVGLDGRKPDVLRLLLLRYLPIRVMGLLPVLGMILPLVDILMIFRSDRRCGHDLIAGTRVVKAR